MRQHVNPLSKFFQDPVLLPPPTEIFFDSKLPIHLDIGCARGNFLMKLAHLNDNFNYLGVDIRSKLIDSAEKEREEKGLDNLRFLFCNANVSLAKWLYNLNKSHLQRVSIQFPDPWFKKRHFKRRILQPELVNNIALALDPGGELFIQSDVLSTINHMIVVINHTGYFQPNHKKDYTQNWLKTSPFPVLTQRESYAISKGLKIYRVMFYRNSESF